MSSSAFALVWHHSKAKGSDLLVALAIADYTGDEGAWPRIENIALRARISERQAQRSVQILQAIGELQVVNGGGRGRGIYKTNLYELVLTCPEDCDRTYRHQLRQDVTFRGDKLSPLGATGSHPNLKEELNKEQRPTKATRLPADFAITEAMREWATANHPDVDIDQATLNFCDYWWAKARDNTKLDWVRTWQIWIRRTTPSTSKPQRINNGTKAANILAELRKGR